MERLVSQSGPRKVGFAIIDGDIRSKHDAIMRISEVVLDEIQRNDLNITDTSLEKAAGGHSTNGDIIIRSSRDPDSIRSPFYDPNSGLESEFVADEGSKIPTCIVQCSKSNCKSTTFCKFHVTICDGNVCPSKDGSTLATRSRPKMMWPTNTGNIMTSTRETSNKQDADKTDGKAADCVNRSRCKHASIVLDDVSTTLENPPHDEPTFSKEIPMCDLAKDVCVFPGFLPHENQSSRLGDQSIVKGEIPDDTMVSGMFSNDREEMTPSKQDPLSLLDLVPADVPKDILSICWRYQHLDDGQLENVRHYMIAKAFGWQGKVVEESNP